MYVPKKYNFEKQEEIYDFIDKNPFAILVSKLSERPWASHIPVEFRTDINGKKCIRGHLAKGNKQCASLSIDEEVLFIFQGPDAYVSSSWYDYEEVPTWNYMAVHVYGHPRVLSDSELLDHLKSLTNRFESASEHQVKVENLSEETMRQIKAIIGFEVTISDIHAVEKLSQGQSEKNAKNIISKLEERKDRKSQEVAKAMRGKKYE